MKTACKALVVSLAAMLAIAVRSAWWETAPTPSTGDAPAAPMVAAETALVVAADLAAPPPAEVGHAHQLELPDGSFVPALNGAVDPAPLRQYWGSRVPWSPIVAVERSQGVDWYRHANGSFSTTQRVWRSDRKEWVTMTRVGHPGPETTPPVAK